MSFKVTWKLHLECLFISLIISYVLRDLINNVFIGLLEDNNITGITGSTGSSLLVFILSLIIISIPITLVHGWNESIRIDRKSVV